MRLFKGDPASDKHIDLELAAMTPEQWKEEFRKELDALREPIERLDALLILYPYKLSRNSAIRKSFAALADEQDNEKFYRIDTDLLEKLYQLLKFLPKADSYLQWLKKQNEISEIQLYALMEFIDFCSSWGNYYDIHKMEEKEKDEVLRDIATNCEHWQKLLGMEQNEWGRENLSLFQNQSPEHVNEEQRLEGLWYTCKPVYLLLNSHPWNKKAKELLDQVYEYGEHYYRTLEGNQQLHVISLMDFGIQSKLPEMVEIRQRDWFSDDIEYKIYGDFPHWDPIQVMHYITAPMDAPEYTVNNLPDLMEAETTIEGAAALLWHLKEQMTYRGDM